MYSLERWERRRRQQESA